MRNDNSQELAQHALSYTKSVCNAENHEHVSVLRDLRRLIDRDLNVLAGNDPDRNK